MSQFFKSAFVGCVLCLSAGRVSAQQVLLDRYPQVPEGMEAAFIDKVSTHAGNVQRSVSGQYFGQFDASGQLYGFGTFFTDNDQQVYGQFARGQFICGIKLSSKSARVGTDDHYISYDLSTGEAQYIMKDGDPRRPEGANKGKWKFLKILYPKGAQYIGEMVGGKRDGYGIYYYKDGDYYYGRFKDNKPVGVGALFKTDGRIILESWDGED